MFFPTGHSRTIPYPTCGARLYYSLLLMRMVQLVLVEKLSDSQLEAIFLSFLAAVYIKIVESSTQISISISPVSSLKSLVTHHS